MADESLKITEKRQEEQQIVTVMIGIYCRGNHKEQRGQTSNFPKSTYFCPQCQDLADYAIMRSQKCPYIAKGTKTFCNTCKTHCYKPEYREKIRKVMRYSGPRLIFYYPGKLVAHFINTKKFKHKVSKN